jgi:hypothetical protein
MFALLTTESTLTVVGKNERRLAGLGEGEES